MGAIEPKQAVLLVFGWMSLLILWGIGASWIWVFWRFSTGQGVLPVRPVVEHRKIPWGSGTVLLAFVVYLAVNLVAFQGYAWMTGRPPGDKPIVANPTAIEKAIEKVASGDPEQAAKPKSGESDRGAKPVELPAVPAIPNEVEHDSQKFSLLELMSIQAIVNLVLILLLPLLVRATSGARLRDLGLSLRRWRTQVLIGVTAILFLLPMVYGCQWLALKILGPFDEQSRHPVEKMLREQFSGGTAALAFLTAVVLAPLFEELMFRAIFQTWLVALLDRFRSRVFEGPGNAPATDQSSALPTEQDHSLTSSETSGGFTDRYWAEDSPDESFQLPPSVDAGDFQGWGDKAVSAGPKSSSPSPLSVGAAIVGTSLIFASLHAGQWPAPIPIFILAIGLGVVYQRTGSLIATICMHALFNGISTLTLFLLLLSGVPIEAEKHRTPPAVEKVGPVEKVKPVTADVVRRPH